VTLDASAVLSAGDPAVVNTITTRLAAAALAQADIIRSLAMRLYTPLIDPNRATDVLAGFNTAAQQAAGLLRRHALLPRR
jgi:hypothetical protein